MPRYELVDKVMFVDAYTKGSSGKPPVELPFPHILDQRVFELPTKKATYTQLSPAEAFIARFIVMGVDTDSISDIYASETGTDNNASKIAVDAVLTLLKERQYLKPRGDYNYSSTPPDPRDGVQDKYVKHTLDFNCNWYGSGQNKVPY